MNDLGVLLLGAVVRSTAIGLLGVLLYVGLRRRGPSAAALGALATLAVMAGVAAMAASPWPRWWTVGEVQEPARVGADRTTTEASDVVTDSEGPDVSVSEDVVSGDRAAIDNESWLTTFARELRRELNQPGRMVAGAEAPAVRPSRWAWPWWVAVAFLAGLAVGLGRLLLGLRAVHILLRRSRPLEDRDLTDLLDILRAEMGVTARVEVRETDEVATPATVGWRRPVVLLPESWRAWDDRERRVVLAHELAHVGRGDYSSGVLAQVCLAVHFYHPLAHWLVGRLRLQQELAADAWGAQLSGGNKPYLTTLAQMALRQSEKPVGWPARAFLPTRGTFLRRLTMLRDAKTVRHAPFSRWGRGLTVGLLAGLGLVIAGVRGPEGGPVVLAQETRSQEGAGTEAEWTGEPEPFDLRYVPADADMVLAIRPAAIFGRPEMKPVLEILNQEPLALLHEMGLQIEKIEQAVLVVVGEQAPQGGLRVRPSGLVRSREPRDWKTSIAQLMRVDPNEFESVRYGGRTYDRLNQPDGGRLGLYLPDDRTVVIDQEPQLRRILARVNGPEPRFVWSDAWESVATKPVALAFNTSLVRDWIDSVTRRGDDSVPLLTASLAPIWEETRAFVFGLDLFDLEDGLAIDGRALCATEEGTQRVEETLRALLVLGRNSLDQVKEMAAQGPRPMSPPEFLIAQAVEPLLTSARVEREATTVQLTGSTQLDVGEFVELKLMQPIMTARAAARRAQSVTNLKRLALALVNYHAAYNQFPPSVIYYSGKNGQTPYSWRVALLPFLDQAALYHAYNFDEPWDSESNLKVLEQMPDVYRVPGAEDSTHACYFVLAGNETIFPDRPGRMEGTPIREIPDGTSNTLLVVEAKRDIPWTKPEDIPYDRDKPLPELGGFFQGGFNAAFADGAVRFISSTIDESVLRALITKAGGEVVSTDRVPGL